MKKSTSAKNAGKTSAPPFLAPESQKGQMAFKGGLKGFKESKSAGKPQGRMAPAAQLVTNAGSGTLDQQRIFSVAMMRNVKLNRFDPMRGFSPERLVCNLEAFEAGYLQHASMMWETMPRRDDILFSVKQKREASVGLRSWAIRSSEEATSDKEAEKEANSQATRLKYFWNNIETVDAYDRNRRGGFSSFVQAVMQAQSQRYGALHMIWRPTPKGLTATIEHVPLRFFENTIGELRFLGDRFASIEGEALDPTNWITFAGCGAMEPASIGYGFKHLALQDWMSYCERYGMPFPIGETTAGVNTPEWTAMEDALDHITNEGSAVIGAGAKIHLLQAAAQGEVPMSVIVERMDKAFSVIYRGSNLATLSAGNSQGASVQANESLIIEAMDCAFVSEVMQQIERRVLDWYDGPGTDALAYGAIKGPNMRDTKVDLDIDDRLSRWGVRLSKRDALERYQREAAADDEEALEVPATAPAALIGKETKLPDAAVPEEAAMNERKPGVMMAHDAVLEDLAPVLRALKAALKASDTDLLKALESLDKNALANAVLASGNLEQALLGEVGQSLADAVNLPDLLTKVINQEKSKP